MTYSVLLRDPATGGFAVAVQSHYLAVGAVVPWALAGVGAVATQAVPDRGTGRGVWRHWRPVRAPRRRCAGWWPPTRPATCGRWR